MVTADMESMLTEIVRLRRQRMILARLLRIALLNWLKFQPHHWGREKVSCAMAGKRCDACSCK